MSNKYFVCDPCYVIPDEKWDDFCDVFNDREDDIFTFEGVTVFAHTTEFGDGCYADKGGSPEMFDVDSGIIGAIPIELCPDAVQSEFATAELEIQECYYDDGIFHIGQYEIDTDPQHYECDECGDTLDYEGEECYSCLEDETDYED